MTNSTEEQLGHYTNGPLPPNVRIGRNSVITGDYLTGDLAFKRFRSKVDPALTIGEDCVMDGVIFNLGEQGRVAIGDHCHFQDAFLICELEVRIGNHVLIGWRATIVDSDFHPISPDVRMMDVIACSLRNSSSGASPARPPFLSKAVTIADHVWIGPNATILKGVHIGAGAMVEPGAVVVRDVPPGARVLGNPARRIEETGCEGGGP